MATGNCLHVLLPPRFFARNPWHSRVGSIVPFAQGRQRARHWRNTGGATSPIRKKHPNLNAAKWGSHIADLARKSPADAASRRSSGCFMESCKLPTPMQAWMSMAVFAWTKGDFRSMWVK